MTPLLRASLRYLARHPWQLGLATLGIALGVAIAVAMDLAIGSAREAFRVSAETVAGRATHQIVAGPAGIESEVYRRIRVELGVRATAPVVEDDVGVVGQPGRAFRLLGVDPLAEPAIRPALGDVATGLTELLREPSVWLARATATELGVAVGDRIAIVVAGREVPLRVAALLDTQDRFSTRALESVLVADIATAQAVLRTDRLSRIDLRLAEGDAGEAALAAIRATLPAGARVVAAGARAEALLEMTRAFRINLTALSLLAVVFGVFFIYNAIAFSVVQRRALFGTLRALGVTRAQLMTTILAEAALLGAIGGIAGCALGIALGRGLVGFVTTTINDLYFVVSVRELTVPATALARGVGLAIGGALLGAVPPAREALGATPRAALTRSTLEATAQRALPRIALAGAALVALGALLLAPRAHLALGFAGLFALIVGCALVVPWLTARLMRLLRPLAAAIGGPLGRLAAGGVTASLSRTSPALAALLVAIATTVALGIMIGSFRASVVAWLETTLQADVYVSAPGFAASRPEAALEPALVRAVGRTHGVAALSTYRSVELLTERGPLRVAALDPAPGRSALTYRLAAGSDATAWRAFERGDVLVSEPLAYRERLRVGDSIVLPTDRGPRSRRVAGIFYDYGPDRGVVLLHRATYDALYDDRTIGSVAVYATPDTDAAALVAALRVLAAAVGQAVNVRSNRALRDASLVVFDRTFVITTVLRALAFIVAFVGVLAAFAALQLERAREFGVLRASGVTPAQVRTLVVAQTGFMGFAAGAFAVPVGTALAALMIFVINRRSFGWSLEMRFTPDVVWQALALAVAAAVLAGIVPAVRLARTPPAAALREE